MQTILRSDRDKNLGSDSVVASNGYSFAILDQSSILMGHIWVLRKTVLACNGDSLNMSFLTAVNAYCECPHSKILEKTGACWLEFDKHYPCKD